MPRFGKLARNLFQICANFGTCLLPKIIVPNRDFWPDSFQDFCHRDDTMVILHAQLFSGPYQSNLPIILISGCTYSSIHDTRDTVVIQVIALCFSALIQDCIRHDTVSDKFWDNWPCILASLAEHLSNHVQSYFYRHKHSICHIVNQGLFDMKVKKSFILQDFLHPQLLDGILFVVSIFKQHHQWKSPWSDDSFHDLWDNDVIQCW